jgi:hypothetical protein
MAGFRYWKWVWTANNGSSRTTVSELTASETIAGADQVAAATVTASSTFIGNVAANVQDSDTTTAWTSADFDTQRTLFVDFGSGNEKLLVEYEVSSHTAGAVTAAPKDWSIFYSSDNITYKPLGTVLGEVSWAAEETRLFTLPFVYVTWKSPHTMNVYKPKKINGNNFIRRRGL